MGGAAIASVAYQIADDGTVTAEISSQGSEGLDGNGTV